MGGGEGADVPANLERYPEDKLPRQCSGLLVRKRDLNLGDKHLFLRPNLDKKYIEANMKANNCPA